MAMWDIYFCNVTHWPRDLNCNSRIVLSSMLNSFWTILYSWYFTCILLFWRAIMPLCVAGDTCLGRLIECGFGLCYHGLEKISLSLSLCWDFVRYYRHSIKVKFHYHQCDKTWLSSYKTIIFYDKIKRKHFLGSTDKRNSYLALIH